MLRLESKILKREFKVYEGNLYASQIRNTLSKMDFIPDGNSVEFLFHFTDGGEFTSKGLTVTDYKSENGKLSFTFAQCEGITVTITLWPGKDGNTLKKQISFVQEDTRVIDYILLEHIGIINSKTHFSVPCDIDGAELGALHSSLGQPFYIDSLFFGCEFPATLNNIEYGIGQVKYYLGKSVEGKFTCPVTVVGGACDNTMVDVQKAFFEYIDDIAQPNYFRLQYNSWFDSMQNIDEQSICASFSEISKQMKAFGAPDIDAFVVDDGWSNYKAPFWSFNKKFPNELKDISALTKQLGSSLGMWLSPKGGYSDSAKFAKRMDKKGFGAVNSATKDICIADRGYQDNLRDFVIKTTEGLDLTYWKFDGFCLKGCTNPKHSHMIGGEQDMYYYTDMWEVWIKTIQALRAAREANGKQLWINMTCYVNPSPWWLQYVNSIWLQNSNDIGFADNIANQSTVEAEITYRDARYYHALSTRAWQIPAKYLYNHEPIYGNRANVEYSDEDFEKYLYFNACRGQALNELYISHNKMNTSKWKILSKVLNWQKENYSILCNATLIGGNPDESNVYGYFSWDDEGNGIIALRNPDNEPAPLTLTLNKLMGCPESLSDTRLCNVYGAEITDDFNAIGYGDKIDLTLNAFEIRILKFTK